jgi:hypothetical protein
LIFKTIYRESECDLQWSGALFGARRPSQGSKRQHKARTDPAPNLGTTAPAEERTSAGAMAISGSIMK